MNFLDLKMFDEETLDIKMPSGNILKIKKPTEKMYMDFVKFQNIGTEGKTDAEIMEIFDKLILKILNHNSKAEKITKTAVLELSFAMKMAIMKAYTEFLVKLTTQKNSLSPQSPRILEGTEKKQK